VGRLFPVDEKPSTDCSGGTSLFFELEMPTPHEMYRAAVDASIAEYDRSNAELIAKKGEGQTPGLCPSRHRSSLSSRLAAALAAYLK
jgi:hypothetical protein